MGRLPTKNIRPRLAAVPPCDACAVRHVVVDYTVGKHTSPRPCMGSRAVRTREFDTGRSSSHIPLHVSTSTCRCRTVALGLSLGAITAPAQTRHDDSATWVRSTRRRLSCWPRSPWTSPSPRRLRSALLRSSTNRGNPTPVGRPTACSSNHESSDLLRPREALLTLAEQHTGTIIPAYARRAGAADVARALPGRRRGSSVTPLASRRRMRG